MKTRPHIFLSLLAIPLLCIALHASATPLTPITNIVTNGGFETGDFTGWTQSGDTSFTGVDSAAANSGNFGAFAGPAKGMGYLSQNLNTVAGMTYDLSFFLLSEDNGEANLSPIAPNGGPNAVFQVFWNGVMIFEIPPNAPPSSYTQFNFNGLVATGGTTELKFGFFNVFSFWDLDDVAAGATSVPEALSTIWLALPVVGMFAFLRLRRQTA